MLTELSLVIINLYASLFGVQSFEPGAIVDNWKIVRSWEFVDGMHQFEADGSLLLEQCQRHPYHYVKFPVVFHSSQEVWADQYLLAFQGDMTRNSTDGVHFAPDLRCSQLRGYKELRWRVFAPSFYFAHIAAFPSLTESRPQVHRINYLVHALGAALLLFIGLFNLIVFRRAFRDVFTACFTASTLLLAAYSFACAPGFYGYHPTMLHAQKLTDAFLTLGVLGIYGLLHLQGFVPAVVCYASIFPSLFALVCVLFGDSQDVSQTGLNINFCFYMLIIFFSFGKAVKRVFWDSWWQGFQFEVIPVMVFLGVAVNDIFVILGLWQQFMLFPAGVVCFLVYQGLYLGGQVSQIYDERESFRRELSQTYRERLQIVKSNAVAHAIASTAQMVAHDVKAPFNQLKMVLERLGEGRLTPEVVAGFHRHFVRSMEYVEGLLDQLSSGAAVAPGRPEVVKLEELVWQVWKRIMLDSNASYQLEVRSSVDVPLYVDRKQVGRVFANLFNNAIEAMEAPANRLWVRAVPIECEGRLFASITVGNEGSYIDDHELENLFTKFYTHGKPGGTGLGLAICCEIVNDHGGDIRCASKRESGTEFTFTLPTTSFHQASEVAP